MSLFELLAKHGIEVPEEKKQGLETEFSESYREAQEFKELNTELEGIKGQLSQANEQIAGFKELDIEGVKQKAAEWEQKYNQAAQDSAREIEQLKFDFALDKELTKAQGWYGRCRWLRDGYQHDGNSRSMAILCYRFCTCSFIKPYSYCYGYYWCRNCLDLHQPF